MAVIRKDVVEVSYEVNTGGLSKVDSQLSNINQKSAACANTAANVAKPFSTVATQAQTAATSVSGVQNSITSASQNTQVWANNLQNAYNQSAKIPKAVTSINSAISQFNNFKPSSAFSAINDKLLSIE